MKNKELLEEAMEKIINKSNESIQTGFEDIDMMLANNEKGSLIIIGARPSMGKTALMTSFLENIIKKEKRCLYFNLEMSNVLLMKRFLCQYCELEFHKVMLSNLGENEIIKLCNSVEELETKDFCIVDSLFKIEEIEQKIKEYKPEYVLIDYLQLIHTNNKKTRNEEITKSLIELKRIAKENNVFMLISSQLSRVVECRYDKRPILSDLRETGSIEEIADVVAFIYREEYYNREYEELWKGKADIIIAKNKFGPTGFVNLGFKASIPKFLPLGGRQFEF